MWYEGLGFPDPEVLGFEAPGIRLFPGGFGLRVLRFRIRGSSTSLPVLGLWVLGFRMLQGLG